MKIRLVEQDREGGGEEAYLERNVRNLQQLPGKRLRILRRRDEEGELIYTRHASVDKPV